MKKKCRIFLNCLIFVLTISALSLMSCGPRAHGKVNEPKPANRLYDIEQEYGRAPKATYKNHIMWTIPPEFRCTPDCPECEARLKRIITEVIDSINNKPQNGL